MDQSSAELEQQVHQLLRNLNDPTKIKDSPWLLSCLVTILIKENPRITRYQALRDILTNILQLIELESPIYADILRGRFWEELEVKVMLAGDRPHSMSERTFANRQKEAIQRFAYLLSEKELSCTQTSVSQSEVSEEARSDDGVVEHQPVTATFLDDKVVDKGEQGLGSSRSQQRQWVFLSILGFMVVGVIGVVLLFRGRVSATLSQTIERPPAPSLTIPSKIINEGHICDEVERTIIQEVPRFIRSEGVSLFSRDNTQGAVVSNKVRALLVDARGLWIGYSAINKSSLSGLGQYDKKGWSHCNQTGELTGSNINAITIDRRTSIWIATENDGVVTFDGSNWRKFTIEDGLPSNKTYSLTVDNKNNIWVGTWDGVAKFDGQHWSVPYTVQNSGIFNNHVISIDFEDDGSIWFGHINHGISYYRAKDAKWIHYTAENHKITGNQVRDIIIDSSSRNSSSTWIATADGGITRFENGEWTKYSANQGLLSADVRALAIDRYNRVWAATERGVQYFDGKIWIKYNSIDTLSIAFGPSCQNCPFDEDHVWTGTAQSGLTHSRLPLPDNAIDVIDVKYPSVVSPGQEFRPEIVVAPRTPYQLREDRGDFLSNTDDDDQNLFGAYPIIPTKGVVEPGQSFMFTDYDNPFKAPQLLPGEQEKTFTSTWRVWMYTRYVGPTIQVTFTVRRSESRSSARAR